MKAVVASSRLGNHGHHDGSRNGRAHEGTKESDPAQAAENSCFRDNPDSSSTASLQEACTTGPSAKAESLEAFQSDCPADSKVPFNGANCES